MHEAPDNLTEEQLQTYDEMLKVAKMRAGAQLGKRIYDALANSDLGIRGLARKSGVDIRRLEKGLAGKLVLDDDEVTRVTDVITIDARQPSRQQRARARKARRALKKHKNDGADATEFLDAEVSAKLDFGREGFTETL